MSDKELIEKIEDAYLRVRKIGPDAIYETELREVLRAAADALAAIERAAAARAQGWPVASSRGSEAMSEQLYPSPSREARLERRRSRAEKRRYRVDYDLAYDGGGSEWSGYYRTRAGAKVAAWWNVHVSSWGGTAVLEGEER